MHSRDKSSYTQINFNVMPGFHLHLHAVCFKRGDQTDQTYSSLTLGTPRERIRAPHACPFSTCCLSPLSREGRQLQRRSVPVYISLSSEVCRSHVAKKKCQETYEWLLRWGLMTSIQTVFAISGPSWGPFLC